jgi:hypothetical protein
VHSLCAVLARRPAVLVDTLRLALAAANTSTPGAEGRGAHNRSHVAFLVEMQSTSQAGAAACLRRLNKYERDHTTESPRPGKREKKKDERPGLPKSPECDLRVRRPLRRLLWESRRQKVADKRGRFKKTDEETATSIGCGGWLGRRRGRRKERLQARRDGE